MRRREFLASVAAGAAGLTLTSSCSRSEANRPNGPRVLVLAFDGLDPKIARSLMDAGKMPNLKRLVQSGGFSSVKTSTPPHTPVAFSNIISGSDASVHQIYDFIHRDPKPADGIIRPYFSTADIVAPQFSWLWTSIPVGGKWQIPLSGGKTVLLRQGPAFWDFLIAAGVDASVYYLPANYPPPTPSGTGQFKCISGMGTPDLTGGYGEFTVFTPDAPKAGKFVDGGKFIRLRMRKNRGSSHLPGPADFFNRDSSLSSEPLSTKIDVVRDADNDIAKIHISGQTILLMPGEWSQWTPVSFQSGIPGSDALGAIGGPTSIQGTVRFFLKSVRPKLEIYTSPINIDPTMPIATLSSPPELVQDMARQHGRFHTNGIPEDTKALSNGALTEEQFVQQSHAVVGERVQQYRYALDEFNQGCLFFYFGATDLLQHMFWRDRDPQHPGRVQEEAEQFSNLIDETYQSIDQQIGDGLDTLTNDDTMIVFSDHGFTSFRRGFNLNTWLVDNGFIVLKDPAAQEEALVYSNVDWSKTKAYGLGLNGLYINEKNRESEGSVAAAEKSGIINELVDKLSMVKDENGDAVISNVIRVDEEFSTADPTIAPDIIVGYADGYRASWETVLGSMPRDQLVDNLDRWSGTHLTDPDVVPGMIASNRPLNSNSPSISDIAPTILSAFGIETPSSMTGKSLFGS